jgi:hypothetical protein
VDRKGRAGALPGLIAALRDADAAATAGWLLAASRSWLDDDIRVWLRDPSPATRRKYLAELGKPLAGLLAASDGTALAGEIVTVLREHGDDVLACLLPMLPMLRAAGPGSSAPIEELAQHCELCGTVGEFLAGRGERTLDWPLAQARPKHVKNQVSAADLPVMREVWKFGSPHTLLLTKTDELFRREAKARKDMAASLGWLTARRKR